MADSSRWARENYDARGGRRPLWRNPNINDIDEERARRREDERDYRRQFEEYERDPQHHYPPRREIDVPDIRPDGTRREWERTGRWRRW